MLKWPNKTTASIILWVMAAFNTISCAIVIYFGADTWKTWTALFVVPFCAQVFDWNRKMDI